MKNTCSITFVIGVKAGMVRVWVAGKTVYSHCYTWAISECFRDKGLIIMRYINSSVDFTLLCFIVFFIVVVLLVRMF